ncbi:MAG: hypothetical protein ACKO0M_15640 [Cyanobium sp.]
MYQVVGLFSHQQTCRLLRSTAFPFIVGSLPWWSDVFTGCHACCGAFQLVCLVLPGILFALRLVADGAVCLWVW